MAVASTLLTFPGANFTPQDFAIMLERVSIIKTGILNGCRVTSLSNNTVSVSEGWAAVRGRVVKVEQGNLSFELPASGSKTYYVILKIDLSNTATPSTIYITDTAPSDEDEDFNYRADGKAYCCLATIITDPLTINQVLTPEVGQTFVKTLAAASWDNGLYRLTDHNFTAVSNQDFMPAVNITAEQLEALQSANIVDAGQGAGYIDLKAYGDVPTVDIPIRVIFRGAI